MRIEIQMIEGDEMYSVIIRIKKETAGDKLEFVKRIIENQYINKFGRIINSSRESGTLVFEGEGDEAYACMDYATSRLILQKDVMDSIESWEWIDSDDPEENGSILNSYEKYFNKK